MKMFPNFNMAENKDESWLFNIEMVIDLYIKINK